MEYGKNKKIVKIKTEDNVEHNGCLKKSAKYAMYLFKKFQLYKKKV